MRSETAVAHILKYKHNPNYLQSVEFDLNKINVSTDLEDFCFHVFGDYSQWQRHVVCLTLQDAATINSFIMRRLPGHIETAAAVDDKVDCKDPDLYSDEYLQSIHIPGMPPALLECKEGAR